MKNLIDKGKDDKVFSEESWKERGKGIRVTCKIKII